MLAFSRVGISGLMTLFELLSILAIILYFTMFFPLLKEALKLGVLGALQTLNSLMTKCNVARKSGDSLLSAHANNNRWHLY